MHNHFGKRADFRPYRLNLLGNFSNLVFLCPGFDLVCTLNSQIFKKNIRCPVYGTVQRFLKTSRKYFRVPLDILEHMCYNATILEQTYQMIGGDPCELKTIYSDRPEILLRVGGMCGARA